ncbi:MULTISPECIES: hypothetical protein [unclassified Nocardia]|uniref:hypothetical protein n=1 Tax=unclassified Nocardia TaxID=2637762 RepID=UPI001CE43C55|nr:MULTISPECIES: hypothetical protein [unclassified Nocardia]
MAKMHIDGTFTDRPRLLELTGCGAVFFLETTYARLLDTLGITWSRTSPACAQNSSGYAQRGSPWTCARRTCPRSSPQAHPWKARRS